MSGRRRNTRQRARQRHGQGTSGPAAAAAGAAAPGAAALPVPDSVHAFLGSLADRQPVPGPPGPEPYFGLRQREGWVPRRGGAHGGPHDHTAFPPPRERLHSRDRTDSDASAAKRRTLARLDAPFQIDHKTPQPSAAPSAAHGNSGRMRHGNAPAGPAAAGVGGEARIKEDHSWALDRGASRDVPWSWLRLAVATGCLLTAKPTPAELVKHRLAHTAELSLAAARDAGDTVHSEALVEFRKQQFERQRLGLETNTRKHDEVSAALAVTKSHEKALQLAMALPGKVISVHWLRAVHEVLCAAEPAAQPGRFRTVGVRSGTRECPHASQVPALIEQVCEEINRGVAGYADLPSVEVVAAAAMMGILDVHPFTDGNGRLSRIVCNWVLLVCAGTPFPVCITPTPEQRKQYVDAIKLGWSDHAVGLHSMADLLQRTLIRTWSEFSQLRERRARQAAESATASAVAKARLEKRAETCIVCFEDNPNIATLCCGTAIHLNCMAKWLAEAHEPTCISCREPLPRPPSRPAAPPQQAPPQPWSPPIAVSWGQLRDIFVNVAHTFSQVPGQSLSTDSKIYFQEGESPFYYVGDNDDTTVLIEGVVLSGPDPPQAAVESSDDETTTTTTTTAVPGAVSEGSDDTTTTTADVQQPTVVRPRCWMSDCRNIAASGCQNSGCGRCCQLHGSYGCARHNA
eukprot:m.214808 g.214808  ORF g.214808 m.214808 type:complete len:686 (-) comp25594_c0_seq2:65-2122(-)